ncbi:MAG: serine/threonine-protein phosphatase [Oscillospiraceae bacterium]|nr:serine/threonine-protein phosphatase [Oscillospiraceae bacterium]
MNANKEKRKGSIILQVATLFAIGILATGLITFISQHARSEANVRLQAEVRSAEIANEVDLAVREYPAYRWLLNYWYEHSGEMKIEYDVDYSTGTLTEDRYQTFIGRNPGVQLKYLGVNDIAKLSEEDRELYAEICYTWLLSRINQIKQIYHIDYLFCVLTDEPYDSQFFLFSGADPGSVRGTNYEEVYPLGVVVSVSESQQEAMKSACEHESHLASAGGYVDYYSFLCSIGEHRILIGLTYSLAGLSADIDAETWRGTSFAIIYQVTLSLLCLVMIYLFVLSPLRKVQKNIRLYKNTKDSEQIEKNLADVDPHNEIGQLSEDVIDLAKELDQHIDRIGAITAEKERIGAELTLASRIQASMIPHVFPPFPDRHEFELFAVMDPAKEVGGDFYDFFLIDDDHLCLVIADVSGKGIPGALFMMVSAVILRSCAMLGRGAAEILTKTNEGICSNNQAEMFVTAWVGILELSTGKLTAANAGHEYPALKRADGSFALFKDKHGLVIGAMPDIRYREYELQLEPGDKLFVYTDGVPEASDAENKMFGTQRMLDALNGAPEASPEQLLRQVHRAVDEFVKDAQQFDDLTMLCVEYKGRKQA